MPRFFAQCGIYHRGQDHDPDEYREQNDNPDDEDDDHAFTAFFALFDAGEDTLRYAHATMMPIHAHQLFA